MSGLLNKKCYEKFYNKVFFIVISCVFWYYIFFVLYIKYKKYGVLIIVMIIFVGILFGCNIILLIVLVIISKYVFIKMVIGKNNWWCGLMICLVICGFINLINEIEFVIVIVVDDNIIVIKNNIKCFLFNFIFRFCVILLFVWIIFSVFDLNSK